MAGKLLKTERVGRWINLTAFIFFIDQMAMSSSCLLMAQPAISEKKEIRNLWGESPGKKGYLFSGS